MNQEEIDKIIAKSEQRKKALEIAQEHIQSLIKSVYDITSGRMGNPFGDGFGYIKKAISDE